MRGVRKKKTYNLDEAMIDKVRRLYAVKTDTEAIQRALQKALDDQELQDSLDRLLRLGRFRSVYE